MANEIKPEQVPDAVVKRFATWQFPKCTNNLMRAMLADALNAWPGMYTDDETMYGKVIGKTIFLPLTTQENGE